MMEEKEEVEQPLPAFEGDPAEAQVLANKLTTWIQRETLDEAEAYLHQHEAELLTDKAAAVMQMLVQANPFNPNVRDHQRRLARARQVGIAAMYAEIRQKRMRERLEELPPALREVMQELAATGATINTPEDLQRLLSDRPDLQAKMAAAIGQSGLLQQALEQAAQQAGPLGQAVWRFVQADDAQAAALLHTEATLLLTLDAGDLLRKLAEAAQAAAGGEGEAFAARLAARQQQWQAAYQGRVGGPLRPTPAEPEARQPQQQGWQERAERQPVQAERGAKYTVIRASQCAIGDYALVINNIGTLPLQWKRPAEGRPRLAHAAVGREVELDELHRRLTAGKGTAVVGRGTSAALRGQPAIGKTTLAAMYADRYGDQYPGGVLWLEVGPNRRSAADALPILQRIATYAYAADAQAQAMLENTAFAPDVVRALLGGHGAMLVVIDDVWDPAILRELQDGLPKDAVVLLTTRDYHVAYALQESADAIQSLDVLSPADARALLQRGAPGLSDELADRVATGLGRHALALTLAAGTLAFRKAHRYEQTAGELLRRVAAGQGFGDLPRMDQTERLTDVEIAFKYSYDELGQGARGAEQQAWFRALGAFAPEADFDTAAAAAVWETDTTAAQEFLLCLDGLSLLQETAADRWQQHALLRAYALSLQMALERIRFPERHADHYLALTQICYESKPRAYDRVEREFAQIQHAFAWCQEHSPRRATRLALLLDDFMRNRGRVALLSQWLQAGLQGAESYGDRLGKANTLKSLGDLESRLGNIEQARAHYDAALPLYEAEQARLGKANTLQSLGDLESRLGNIEQARAHYDAALPLYEAEQARLGKANTLQSLGDLESRLGNIEQARAHYDAALPLYEAEQDPIGKMNTWISLARLEASLDRLPEAERYYQQTFDMAERIGFANHPVVQGWRQEYAQLTSAPDAGLAAAQALADRLIAWIQTPDWDASEEYLQAHAAELLADEAEAVLALLRQANPQAPAIPQHQVLLHRCREIGIEAAYREFHAAMAAAQQMAQDPAVQALAALLQVDSMEALEQALAQHPILLELPTLEQLAALVAKAQEAGQPDSARQLLLLLGILLDRYNRAHTEQVEPAEQARFVALCESLLSIAAPLDEDFAAGLRQVSAWALNTLGNAHAEGGDHAAAVEAYTRAIAHTPEEAMLYRNRAGEYIEMEKWAEAERDIERAAALEPDAPRLIHLRQALANRS